MTLCGAANEHFNYIHIDIEMVFKFYMIRFHEKLNMSICFKLQAVSTYVLANYH